LIQRTFILGDEWIYYKIYCGKRTADAILIDVVKPLTEELLQQNLIDYWFFIRYTDPKPHLRVRFHCDDISKIGSVINIVKYAINPFLKNGLVWTLQTDTYNRELERYGFKTIEASEHFFHIDSEICVNVLSLIEDDELLFLFALRYVDNILNIFDFNQDAKIVFTKRLLNAFKREFNTDKKLSKQLNIKYQSLRASIESFMLKPNRDFNILLDLLSSKDEKLKRIANSLMVDLKNENITKEDILSSYIHMTVNRLFRDKQRLHELVCYNCLYRFYEFQKNVNA